MSHDMKYCFNCGTSVKHTQKFCALCGTNLQFTATSQQAAATIQQSTSSIQDQVKGTFNQATEKINHMVGEEGSINVNLSDLFSDVFKKHSKEEGEQLFISGTTTTTPDERDISTSWPKPWLFSRVFLVLATTYILLVICTISFQNINALPGMIIIGSFAAPVSLLILFWEMNAPRNISFYEIAKMLFVGGASSLVATLFLYAVFPVYDLSFSGAIVIGIIEEIGKLVIIGYFIKKLQTKFILNGLLIGATIGAGFAAFESAGYAYTAGVSFGEDAMISIIFMRAWMSVGTHIVWSAIAGAALVYVKGDEPLSNHHFLNGTFLKLFSVPIMLHAIWDMPLHFLHHFYFLFIALIIIAWLFVFSFMNAGLKQIMRLRT